MMEQPILNKKENNETREDKAERVKSKLSKVKKYVLALLAAGYIGEGITGFNNADEKLNFSDFKTTEAKLQKGAEVNAKALFIYPVIETMEDVADFLQDEYPDMMSENGKGVTPAEYDFNRAFQEKKSILDIAKDLVREENGGKDYDLLNLHAYIKARELARVNSVKDIDAPISTPAINFHYE